MCGIVGYFGKKEALLILIDGLRRLEYRGYDSAGVGVADSGGKINTAKSVGKVESLEKLLSRKSLKGNYGIAHTRWATHGRPSDKNSHPHHDCHKNIFLVHNGIIENYRDLKEQLLKRGHKFYSETDTEVLCHLIEDQGEKSLEESVVNVLKMVRGTYGIAVISEKDPNKIVVSRFSSPLLIGINNGEFIIASDASAILKYTKQVVYLNDGEMAIITPSEINFTNLSNDKLTKESEFLEWDIAQAQKGGYKHFMLKEIFEQPEAINNSIAGRLIENEGLVKLGGLENVADKIKNIDKIIIVGCGTAYLAGLVGKYMIEECAGIPVQIDVASELRYRNSVIDKNTALLCVSQSGETADTLAVLSEAKRRGVLTLGIVNVVGSSIARNTDAGIYNHIGPEIGVASTKAFISQLSIFALLALFLGRQRQMSLTDGQKIIKEINRLPDLIDGILKQCAVVEKMAKKYYKFNNFLFLGRKYNYPIALEGALKLKEVSYIHAEGYSAGEIKHGPIAMIDKNFPTFGIVPSDSVYEKMISNLEEIKARGGPILAIATEGDNKIQNITKDVIYVPKAMEMLSPILSVIPLQLFAYYCGVFRGLDVDKPRNLAKSVTVE